jgi:hypothetical protein
MPKIACSPTYADFRPKTNAVVSLDVGHTVRGDCAQEGKERQPKT